MSDGDKVYGKFLVNLDADFADFGDGHGFVSFIVEIECAAAVRVIADAAVKSDYGAVFGGADVANQGYVIDGLTDESVTIVLDR